MNRKGILLLAGLLVTGAALLPHPLAARQVEREVRVPLAAELGIVEIDAPLRARLGLFPEVEGFVAGRLLLREGGTTVLEIESLRSGRLERERRTLTAEEEAALRDDLAARVAAAGSLREVDREGRGGFVLTQTLLGLGFNGWAVPLVLELSSGQAIVATYLLTAGASFYLPYRGTRGRTVSEAHRDLSFYGGTRGILVGALLGDAFVDRNGGSDADTRVRVGVGLAGSVTGSVLGFLAADRGRPDPARAALWTALGDFGFLSGAATAWATGPYASHDVRSEDGLLVESRTRNPALGHALTIAGGAGGLLAGRWLSTREAYTEGNVHALRSAALLGTHSGLALTRAFGVRDDQALVAGALVGGLAGVALGNRQLRSNRFTAGEGLLVNAAHIAGGAAALGFTYLAVQEIESHPVLYLGTSALGAWLGAGLVYRALGEGSAAPPGSTAAGPSSERAHGVTVALHLENLLMAPLLRPDGAPLPVFSVRF